MSGPPTTQRDLEGGLGGQFPSRENSLTGLTPRHFKFANTSERKTVGYQVVTNHLKLLCTTQGLRILPFITWGVVKVLFSLHQ